VGEDFARDDERREDRERGETDGDPRRPMTSGVSRGRGKGNDAGDNEQNRQYSTHRSPFALQVA
jgi:hypothetical protein